ncbi:MAG: hypothetical protein HY525_18255 [Betaproteobacteria bacterium]|nr:hypothetical protein [Betaproteobacteria bacterium]
MNQASNNPPSNQLGAEVNDDQLRSAIEKSGYPLQTIVGNMLRSKPESSEAKFGVQEEWGFIDQDTKKLRNLDLRADLRLHDWNSQLRVRPQLTLLIECKQSQLPYVFFETGDIPWLNNFPVVAGLRTGTVDITSDDDPSSLELTVIDALGLDQETFQKQPHFCYTLSKCVRDGKNLEISGSETYNGLVLPLVKALQHFVLAEAPVNTAWYFDGHLTVALAVLDAPMIGVSVNASAPTLTMRPWLRIIRHEYDEDAEKFDRNHVFALDVVHKDFLSDYLDKHLLPFAACFAERVLRHPTELATGEAFVRGMAADISDLETRMQPRSTLMRVLRTATTERILNWIHPKNVD